MSSNNSTIASKVWSFCNTLRYITESSRFLKWGILTIVMALSIVKTYAQVQPEALQHTFPGVNGFIENKGQLYDQFHQKNKSVKYLLHGDRMNVQLKANSFSYDTYQIVSGSKSSRPASLKSFKRSNNDSTVYRFHRIDIEFPGANPFPQIIAEEKSKNYNVYYSPDETEGVRVHSFRRVVYKEIYKGIDLLFDSRNLSDEPGFEYYFVIKPGADPRQIKIKYNGASTSLQNNRIIINTVNGKIEETIPASFLISGKSTLIVSQLPGNTGIKVNYRTYRRGIYEFSIPAYDKTKTLVIDPTPDLVWGTYYGGGNNDWAYAIDQSPDGTIIVGGFSQNANLATAGAFQTTFAGFDDAMLGKFGADGSLMWMTYYGGEWSDVIFGICTDYNGNIFVTGITDSKTGISTPGSHQPVHGDAAFGRDGFLAKFTPQGNRAWATYYGGTDADYLHTVKADANGNLFIAGWTYSLNGISTPGAFQTNYASNNVPQDWGDGFLVRFDNNGNRIWGTYYGGTSADRFYDLELDNNGNLCATGLTYSTGMASTGVFQTALGGLVDVLIAKFNNNGNRIWATYYGGSELDYAEAVTCDNLNNIIVGGTTGSTSGIATAGTFLTSFAGDNRDGFVAKFDQNGNRIWGTYYGGNGQEFLHGITSDINNNIIITGSSFSTNNITTANSYQPSGSLWTPFIAKLNSIGNQVWGTYYGYGNGSWNGDGESVVTDMNGNIFACGETMAPSGIATCNAVQGTWAGNQDMYIAMFSETIVPATVSVSITSGQNGFICSGAPATFTAVTINGGTNPTYQWKVNGVNVGTNSNVFTTSSLNNGDQVSCTVTSNSPCITIPTASSNIIIAAITPSVIPAISITSSNNGTICTGTAVTFTATPTNGGNAPIYQWKINGSNVGTNSAAFITSSLTNGDIITCELTNPGSCNPITSATSNTITINVSSTITPTVVITSSVTSACKGTPVTFTASVVSGGNSPAYQWKVNGNTVGNNITYTTSGLNNNDTIQCFITPDNVGCVGPTNITSNKIGIPINPLPVFTIQPNNPIIEMGDTLQLIITGTDISKYKWSPPQYISNDTIFNPLVWPDKTQIYNVEIASVKGCIAKGQVTVSVITGIFIPTAFTPNNDGINDFWGIKGLELYPGCLISVYNRWGQIIYQSAGYSKPWDGTIKGQLPQSSTFVYLIDFKNGNKPLFGTVTVIR
jgi:gliding motility-associated-like protein